MSTSSFRPKLSMRSGAVMGFNPTRRADRSLAVCDAAGRLIASVTTGTVASKFLAVDPLVLPLCAGQAQGAHWSAVDADGIEIVRINHVPFRAPVVRLRGGRLRATLTGSPFAQRWALCTTPGSMLLRSEFTVAGRGLAPGSWSVRSDGELTTAEIISVVHLHRLQQIRARRVGFAAGTLSEVPLA